MRVCIIVFTITNSLSSLVAHNSSAVGEFFYCVFNKYHCHWLEEKNGKPKVIIWQRVVMHNQIANSGYLVELQQSKIVDKFTLNGLRYKLLISIVLNKIISWTFCFGHLLSSCSQVIFDLVSSQWIEFYDRYMKPIFLSKIKRMTAQKEKKNEEKYNLKFDVFIIFLRNDLKFNH